jgi:transposase
MAFRIALSEEEQQHLHGIIQRGKVTGRVRTRAQLLLKIAEGWSIEQMCAAFDVSRATVYNTAKRHQQGGIDLVTHDRRQARRRRGLAGEEEAILVAITCSPIPESHDHWTLRMLRDKLIEVGIVEHISAATIHTILKKTNSNPGNTNHGASPC